MAPFKPRPTKRPQTLRRGATEAERRLWPHLSCRQVDGYRSNSQMPVGPFICEFMCRQAKLVVEGEGGQHGWNASADASRTLCIEPVGYCVHRFRNNKVPFNVEGVLSRILVALTPGPLRKLTRNAGGA
ncbi:DUF559 domain-containing protein [Sphingosinicella rhizophila]|uniref:DUF559 domain-containing protein n=1 Tax=Sphingosinicella rhizophila TaxID=3050082 RepID=A0ABU3Q2X6_9SPHN|nr:DUF559 domain-containing protein [Sphingosinicella sp. GR2756]MDT9597617.1 DUF559 domain-containing protein [Sphingosinicella sp. GR2756]